MADAKIQTVLDYRPPEPRRPLRTIVGSVLAWTGMVCVFPPLAALLLICIVTFFGGDWQNYGLIEILYGLGMAACFLGMPLGFIGMRFFGSTRAGVASVICYASLVLYVVLSH